MTYDQAIEYLNGLTNYERRHEPEAMRQVRLDRMQRLCERLGDPQRRVRAILVSGTNAKGSICAMIYEILRAARKRVGLYTSPHLEDVRERIRTSGTGRPEDRISREEFAAAVERLRPAIDACAAEPELGAPTYFEAMTAAAFVHFAQQRVETAVLEVGMGGRLDATNVAEPVVSVIGPIGLDHTDVLGLDAASIAREKAGIMRPSRPVICAPQCPDAAVVLREQAQARGARLIEYGQPISARVFEHDADGLLLAVQGLRGTYESLRVPLLGRHQAENAALAVGAVETLTDRGALRSAVRTGLGRVRWPGRLEVVSRDPLVILDGGHNPPAARALRATIEELWPGRPLHLVIGLSADKPLAAVAEILGPMAATLTCTSSGHPRACPPRELADCFGRPGGRPAAVVDDPLDACTCVRNAAKPGDIMLVAGSLFLAGRVRAGLSVGRRAGSRQRDDRQLEAGACPSSP